MGLTAGDSDHEKNLVTISLVDYGRTRDEIDKRTALSAQLLNFQIILVAAVCSGFDKFPKEALIVVSCLSSVLWLMWIDHTSQIYKLAAYNEIVIARRLRAVYPDVLGWEAYLRRLESDTEICAALGIDPSRKDHKLLRTEYVGHYTMMLFMGSAVALAGYYIWVEQTDLSCRMPTSFPYLSWCLNWKRSIGVFSTALLLSYAVVSNRRLANTTRLMGEAMRSETAPNGRGVEDRRRIGDASLTAPPASPRPRR